MAQLVKINPGTKAFDAWLEYYAGTKTADRMMSCVAMQKPFLAPSRKPPERPKADASRVTVRAQGGSIAEVFAALERKPARIEDIAERLEKRAELDKADARQRKDRRKSAERVASGIDKAAQRVREGNRPQIDDLADVGTIAVVDPDEAIEVMNGKRAPDKLRKRVKLTSLRDDPVGRMHARDQINDEQIEAARRYQAWLHQAEIGGAKGIDPSRMRVDGGGCVADVNTDTRMHAAKALARVDAQLGYMGRDMVRRVLGEGMEVRKVAAIYGNDRPAECERLGWFFRKCLDQMVSATGVVVRGKGGPARGVAIETEAGDADQGVRMKAAPIKPAGDCDAGAIAARYADRMRAVPQATARANRDGARKADKPGTGGAGKGEV